MTPEFPFASSFHSNVKSNDEKVSTVSAYFEAPKLAVFLHLYHENLTPEFQRYLRNIPFAFDLFITTDSPALLGSAEAITAWRPTSRASTASVSET